MKPKLKQLKFGEIENVHIPHKNENKLDNRFLNLKILSKEEHEVGHQKGVQQINSSYQSSYNLNKAFETWCEKVHGCVDENYYDDFQRWLEVKNGY